MDVDGEHLSPLEPAVSHRIRLVGTYVETSVMASWCASVMGSGISSFV
jgi:hypothetical protein